MYDSMYNKIDKETRDVIVNLCGSSIKPCLAESSQQSGGTDSGLFAIANATALAFGINPAQITFNQPELHTHLVKCMEGGKFSIFPLL